VNPPWVVVVFLIPLKLQGGTGHLFFFSIEDIGKKKTWGGRGLKFVLFFPPLAAV
jgi:hypothetical protein